MNYTNVTLILQLDNGEEITETFTVKGKDVADAIEQAERQAKTKYDIRSTYVDVVS